MKKILFVCSGNTCRSPLAEGIARKLLNGRGGLVAEVSSAGTSALEGQPASEFSVDVARRQNIDISGHRSRLLSARLVREADLIVTMGGKHRQTVEVIEPAAGGYTQLLSDFCDDIDGDVPDPIGADEDVYAETFTMIERCLDAMASRLEGFDGWKRTEPEDD